MFFSLKVLAAAEEDAEDVHEDQLQQVREVEKCTDDDHDAEEFIEQPRSAGSRPETAREILLRPGVPSKCVQPPGRLPHHRESEHAKGECDRETRPEKYDGDIEQSNPDTERNKIF